MVSLLFISGKNMRKALVTSILLLIATIVVAQSFYQWRVQQPVGGAQSTGNTGFVHTGGLPATFASITWTVTGTLATCTVQVDFSNDGFTVAGQLIAAQTCTASGSFTAAGTATPAYARVSYVIGTGGGTLGFTAYGCNNNTCTTGGGGSSGTVTSVGSGTGLTGGPITTTGSLALSVPVSVVNGGTGTTTPALIAGTNITITGTWPNNTINATGGGSGTVTNVATGTGLSGGPITTTGTLTLTDPVNTATGYEIGGAAPSAHILAGNGTNYVDTLVGVPINPQTGTTYTYVASDRASHVTFSNAGAIAVTLPQAGTTGFGNNFITSSCDIGAGTTTITPTTSTISYTNGTTYTSAASTLPLTTGQCATIYTDNTNYFAILYSGSTGSGTVASGTSGQIAVYTGATTVGSGGSISSGGVNINGGFSAVDNLSSLLFSGTNSSTAAGSTGAIRINTTFAPTTATNTNVEQINATLGNATVSQANLDGFMANLTLGSTYTGTAPSIQYFEANVWTNNTAVLPGSFTQFQGDAITNGGNTSGIINNANFANLTAFVDTAAAGNGGVVNNSVFRGQVPTGAAVTGGTNNNRAIDIRGNGATGCGGTCNNWAIDTTGSTAQVAFGGPVTLSSTLTASNGGTLSGTYAGTPNFSAAVTFSGTPVFSKNGSSSTSGVTLSGTSFTGGTGTTTFPWLYRKIAAATAPTTFSTAGTVFGIDEVSGFTGNFFDFYVNGGSSIFSLAATGNVKASLYSTISNCSNGASPAVCGSAASGSVALPTGTNPTLVVNTTAVTATSQIHLTVDESITIGGTTCNTTLSTLVNPVVTARTAGTSFTFTMGAVIATNPACVSYTIIN